METELGWEVGVIGSLYGVLAAIYILPEAVILKTVAGFSFRKALIDSLLMNMASGTLVFALGVIVSNWLPVSVVQYTPKLAEYEFWLSLLTASILSVIVEAFVLSQRRTPHVRALMTSAKVNAASVITLTIVMLIWRSY